MTHTWDLQKVGLNSNGKGKKNKEGLAFKYCDCYSLGLICDKLCIMQGYIIYILVAGGDLNTV